MEQGDWGWQLVDTHSGAEDSSLVASEPAMPTVLECWDWQGLDLGHPGQWHDSPFAL